MKNKWCEVKNQTDLSADIYIYGEIVDDEFSKWSDTDKCPDDFIQMLNDTKGKAKNIYINSPGGNVFAGLAIYNMLKRCGDHKKCIVDGYAASISSVIAMCSDEPIEMPDNTFMVVHKPWNMVMGNATDLRNSADDLDRIQTAIEEIYKSKMIDSEKDMDTLKQMIEDETWLSAKQAAEIFDVNVLPSNSAAAKIEMPESLKSFYKKIPESIKNETKKTNKNEKTNNESELELLKMQFEFF
ncbi:MAG: Clp protease ClpP [Clostridia bacterium]|jgi:ATP-dependent protease ClpP protease subunit|nr:Clp protease ClpP [Clostridia bacterium]